MYSAEYQPSLAEGEIDPSRHGFKSLLEAEAYMFSQMCRDCKEERRQALAGEGPVTQEAIPPSKYPACTCEWVCGLTSELCPDGVPVAG